MLLKTGKVGPFGEFGSISPSPYFYVALKTELDVTSGLRLALRLVQTQARRQNEWTLISALPTIGWILRNEGIVLKSKRYDSAFESSYSIS